MCRDCPSTLILKEPQQVDHTQQRLSRLGLVVVCGNSAAAARDQEDLPLADAGSIAWSAVRTSAGSYSGASTASVPSTTDE